VATYILSNDRATNVNTTHHNWFYRIF